MLVICPVEGQSHKKLPEIVLWPDVPPYGPGPLQLEKVSDEGSHTNITTPRLIVHKPKHSNGTAILVISGGGYAHIEAGKESGPAAAWLQSQGITAFELIYRLPAEGWEIKDVPFQDGQRAMRLIRSMAKKYNLDTGRIGMMGFSAGGHLAGMIATKTDQKFYSPVDAVDNLSSRPNFVALLYPVITMLPPYNHTHSEKEILGKNPTKEQQKDYSVETRVDDRTPPTFLAQAMDDSISNVENSRLIYAALQKYKVPAQLHLFPSGGHGWGMGTPGSPVAAWPELFKAWAKQNKFWK